MKTLFLLTVLTLTVLGNVFGQKEKSIKRPIVNGMATELPKPDYPQEAKDFCASGKVKVEVLIGENGNVIEAKAISGDELLYAPAIEAAKKAKFMTGHLAVKVEGIIVYNFDSLAKCIEVKVPVNKRALSIPRPKIANLNKPKHLQIRQEEIVEVQIIVEVWSGKVLRARAVSGHPMLRAACENSARGAKFSAVNDVPLNPVKAILVYKFKPNGKIEF